MSFQIDEEKTRSRLAEIQKIIQTEANPELLNVYRSLIRKEISFFSRSYLSAYLLMQLEEKDGGRSYRNRIQKPGRFQDAGSSHTDERPELNRFPLSDEESTRLFISIGRNRKVFPREILGLINSKTEISKDDIGNIKIFDNYSFVQVRTTVAEEIIEALNGKHFRGRTLAVNYARSKKDDETEPSEEKEETLVE